MKHKKQKSIKTTSKANAKPLKVKLSPINRVFTFVDPEDTPDIRARYAAIAGMGRPPEELLSSNTVEANAVAKGIADSFLRYLAENPSRVCVQKQRIGVTSGAAPIIEVSALRKMVTPKGATEIGGIRFSPLPDPSDSSGSKVALEAVTVHFGSNAETEARRMSGRNRARFIPGCEQAVLTWLEPTDQQGIREAIGDAVKPMLTLPPSLERELGLPFPDDWNRNRAMRALNRPGFVGGSNS